MHIILQQKKTLKSDFYTSTDIAGILLNGNSNDNNYYYLCKIQTDVKYINVIGDTLIGDLNINLNYMNIILQVRIFT